MIERLFLEILRAVLWMRADIVGADGDDADRPVGVVATDAGELRLHMDDEGAVRADEHHQRPFLPADVFEAEFFAADHVFEGELPGARAQPEHGGFRQSHRSTSCAIYAFRL